jgi:hypothetical protein
MTAEQINLVQTGFSHMVDNGYGKIESLSDVILSLEVSLEYARREARISAAHGMDNEGAATIIAFLEPKIRNLKSRAGL